MSFGCVLLPRSLYVRALRSQAPLLLTRSLEHPGRRQAAEILANVPGTHRSIAITRSHLL
jgi:hypothetical protein